jgi:hypothetical protein
MANPYGRRPADPLQRFLKYVDKTPESGCWLWSGCTNKDGYGTFRIDGRSPLAHRVSWQLHIGAIPAGVQLDHTCHDPLTCLLGSKCPHRRCVNPSHLEETGLVENIKRGKPSEARLLKLYCKRGHPYDAERKPYLPYRRCMICAAAWKRQNRKSIN